MAGWIRANRPPLIAMSAFWTAAASGRTTRTFRIRRSYFLSSSAKTLLQVREEAAVAHDLHEVRRERLALQPFTGSEIRDLALLERNPKHVAIADAPGLAAHHGRQAEVERVAVEKARERFRHERGGARVLRRRGSLLARRAGAEVAAGDHDVSRLHRARELREQRLEAMRRDSLDAELHVPSGRDGVGTHVVAQHPGSHCSISRGSQMCPATAEAATV